MSRLSSFILLLVIGLFANAQQVKDTISVSFVDIPFEQVLDLISTKSGYAFTYNAELIPKGSLYALTRENIQIDRLMELILIGSKLEYVKSGDQIVLIKKVLVKKGSLSGAQISGKVVTKEGAPLPGVSVFLNGTTIGAVTDSTGIYAFHCEPGVFQVVFSHVEYETSTVGIRVMPNLEPIQVNAELGFKYQVLPDIEIFSNPTKVVAERMKYMSTFEKEFLGASTNGAKCEIENPEVLYFSNDPFSGVLKAFADVPIIVINEALGYRLEAILEFFEKDTEITRFHVRARFYELDAKNNRTEKQWTKNRLKAYYGSKPHFLHAFVKDKLSEEGFKISGVKNVTEVRNENYLPILRDSIVVSESPSDLTIKYDSLILVEYVPEKPDKIFLKSLYDGELRSYDLYAYSMTPKGFRTQRSLIHMTEGELTIEKTGLNYNKFALDVYGYWSWERVGELLPTNYKVGK